MNWQEYQEAVGELYLRMQEVGRVSKNITIPDNVTGQPRQVDVWIELEVKTHKIGILIDAKYRKTKVDVKDVEEVLALSHAVGANKCVLVALNGWTEPAEIKASIVGMDLRILSLEQALDLMVPDKWLICPECENDCIVMDFAGGTIVEGMWSLLTTGRCRECLAAKIYCWDCGDRIILKLKEQMKCECKHLWNNEIDSIKVKIRGDKNWREISKNLPLFDPESANVHINLGLSYKAKGEIEQAINEFTQAIEKAPISAVAYYHRGITYDEYNQIEKAIADYTAAIELHPDYAMAYGSRGIAYYTLGYFREAVKDLEQYILLEPDSTNRTLIESVIEQTKKILLS